MSGLSAFLSGGQTHTDSRGNTVTSSAQANNASRSINAVFAATIPFVGGIIGDLAGNEVAKSIDKVRDDIHNISTDAQETTNAL